ncbi:sulfotransferase domain-containing protein [Aquabacter cavernae]|uniref:sulfotransferase domain-containing protein n=1 Tax=Aquabacter cavernae TaxID=2496029 RepID=UPI000F8D1B97|nr:sulfotransferase domain-containing protein [Aquabacter cavernae]
MSGYYWLASYPKSGNTWLRLMIQVCLSGAGIDINRISVAPQIGINRRVFDDAMGVSASDLTPDEVLLWRPAVLRARAANLSKPLILKTHEHRYPLANGDWLHPPECSLGAVYVVRDPRDVAISLARHLRMTIDRSIEIMASADMRIAVAPHRLNISLVDCWGSWSANVGSWLAPGTFPVSVVRFEDLRADPARELARVLPNLALSADAATIAAAVEATAIGKLRAQESVEGFREWKGDGTFFGSGEAGGWRRKLSAEQARRIVADHGDVMKRLHYLD